MHTNVITDEIRTAVSFEERPQRWGWLLALGILMVISGTIGVIASVAFTIAGVVFFGSLLLVAGLFQLIHGITGKEKKWVGALSYFAHAVLYIVMGGLIFWNPVAASAGLTLVLAGLFCAIGCFRLYEAWRRRQRGWLWLWPALAGLLEVAFAVVIVLQWPFSGLWVIGMLIAVEFILNGWLLVATALATRRFLRRQS